MPWNSSETPRPEDNRRDPGSTQTTEQRGRNDWRRGASNPIVTILLGIVLAVFGGGPPLLAEGEGDSGTEAVLQERSLQKARLAAKLPATEPRIQTASPCREEHPLKSRLDSWIARRWFRTPS